MKTKFAVSGVVLGFSFLAMAGEGSLPNKPPLEAGGLAAAPVSQCDAVSGNLVANCGFETGDFTNWTLSGDLSFTGVDVAPAHSGTFGAFLGPITDLGFAAQTLVTTPGQYYDLTF